MVGQDFPLTSLNRELTNNGDGGIFVLNSVNMAFRDENNILGQI